MLEQKFLSYAGIDYPISPVKTEEAPFRLPGLTVAYVSVKVDTTSEDYKKAVVYAKTKRAPKTKRLMALDFILTIGEHHFILKHSLGTGLAFGDGCSHSGETKFSLTSLILSNIIAEEDIETAKEKREFDVAHEFVESILKLSQGKDVIATINYDIYLEGDTTRIETDMVYFGKTDLHTFLDFIGGLKIYGCRPHLQANN